jgi:hypothetical protein
LQKLGNSMISRRRFACGTFAFALTAFGSRSTRALAPDLPAGLGRIEADSGGRLGQVGDKTGSGERGTANDVGIIGSRRVRPYLSRFISRSRRNRPTKEMPSLLPSAASLRRHCDDRSFARRGFLPRAA